MNDELKRHLLLSQANLESHDRNLVVRSAGGDYSLHSLATSLRNVFRTERVPLCIDEYQPCSLAPVACNIGPILSRSTASSQFQGPRQLKRLIIRGTFVQHLHELW